MPTTAIPTRPDDVVLILSIEDATALRNGIAAARQHPYINGPQLQGLQVLFTYVNLAIEQAIRRATDPDVWVLPLTREFDPTDQDPT